MARAKNSKIRKANTVVELTPEQVHEFMRCANDPIYFCKKYVKVQHPTRGAIPLVLYDYQEEMIRMMVEERFSIFLSARQTGKCPLGSMLLNTLTKPRSRFKMLLLKLLDRKLYDCLNQTTD